MGAFTRMSWNVLSVRATILCETAAIDAIKIPDGDIAKVYTGVKPVEHSEQVLKDLAELKKS